MKTKGFTLIEIMITAAILAIVAAIALPVYANSQQQSKESTAKNSLAMLRTQAEVYKMQHKGRNPGYVGTFAATAAMFVNQFVGTSKLDGSAIATKTPTAAFPCGPYLMQVPKNPFNGKNTIKLVAASVTDFSTAVDANYGWLYQKETCTFKLSLAGTDSKGVAYISY